VFAFLQEAAINAGNDQVATVSMDDVLAMAKENNWDDCLLGQAPVAADLVSIELPTRHRIAKSAAVSALDASDPDSSQDVLMAGKDRFTAILETQSSSDQDASIDDGLLFPIMVLSFSMHALLFANKMAFRKSLGGTHCLEKSIHWLTLH
jgi:hypothetical protein